MLNVHACKMNFRDTPESFFTVRFWPFSVTSNSGTAEVCFFPHIVLSSMSPKALLTEHFLKVFHYHLQIFFQTLVLTFSWSYQVSTKGFQTTIRTNPSSMLLKWSVNWNINVLQLSNHATRYITTKFTEAVKLHHKCHHANSDYMILSFDDAFWFQRCEEKDIPGSF